MYVHRTQTEGLQKQSLLITSGRSNGVFLVNSTNERQFGRVKRFSRKV